MKSATKFLWQKTFSSRVVAQSFPYLTVELLVFFWPEGFEISSCKLAFFLKHWNKFVIHVVQVKVCHFNHLPLAVANCVLFKLGWINVLHVLSISLPHAVNYRRFCFLAPSVLCFLFVYETIPRTSLKVKVTGTVAAFFGPFGSLRAVYVW